MEEHVCPENPQNLNEHPKILLDVPLQPDAQQQDHRPNPILNHPFSEVNIGDIVLINTLSTAVVNIDGSNKRRVENSHADGYRFEADQNYDHRDHDPLI